MSSFKKNSDSSEFLHSQYPSRNSTIQWFNKKFCDWRWYPILRKNPKDRGHPAPLWKNHSPAQYRIFYTLNLISSVIFVFFFCILQVYNISQNTSTALSSSNTSNSTVSSNSSLLNSTNQNAASVLNGTTNNTTNTNTSTNNNTSTSKSTNNSTLNNTLSNNSTIKSQDCFNLIQQQIQPHFIIIGSVILLLNALMARFMSRIEYASDEEWFRYLVLNFTCCVTLSLFNFFEYFDFKNNLAFYNSVLITNYSDEAKCIIFFNVNLWSTFVNTVAITVVCVLQILMIFNNFKFYFLSLNEGEKIKQVTDVDLFVYEA